MLGFGYYIAGPCCATLLAEFGDRVVTDIGTDSTAALRENGII